MMQNADLTVKSNIRVGSFGLRLGKWVKTVMAAFQQRFGQSVIAFTQYKSAVHSKHSLSSNFFLNPNSKKIPNKYYYDIFVQFLQCAKCFLFVFSFCGNSFTALRDFFICWHDDNSTDDSVLETYSASSPTTATSAQTFYTSWSASNICTALSRISKPLYVFIQPL